jgi:FixJ family two-component response regulator
MTPAASPTVFVVDDDDLVRASIQGMLKSVGLRSETFGTAQEFLRSKRPDGPSCLVLDVRLPGVNGLDFSASWLTPASGFPSSLSPVMETFR